MKEIIIATKNKGKAVEFENFFSIFNIKAVSLLDLNESIPDIEETGTTFAENAKLKAEGISAYFNLPVLGDDSGLIIDALNGRPGIYSARYAGANSSDQENIDKVMVDLDGVAKDKRSARFICVIAIAIPGGTTTFHTGYCEGSISMSQAGENGFGYDSIFIPTEHTKTMAEISSDKKNEISHRKNAIVQMEQWMKKYQS